jgi:MFS family permease
MPDDSRLRAVGIAPVPRSIESRASWVAAGFTLAILSVSYGGPLIIVVGLKTIQDALGTDRSVLALAGAFVWVGTGLGGIAMGRLADRIGMRATAMFGAVMMAAGLALSATGSVTAILIGHGLLIGLIGNGALYPPLVTYVSRWFDRRRGTAIALISSGQYIAGIIWPFLFERAMASIGWQVTMLGYALLLLVAILPMAFWFLQPPPEPVRGAVAFGSAARHAAALGLRPNTVQVLICLAGFLCCVPMALPNGHLVAFCSDIGIPPADGAAMLSVLLGAAFISRQFWGAFADRYGGLLTVFAGSACQALAIGAFMLTQNEAGLFAIAAAFGLGFSGIIPAYVVAIRDLLPAAEASWRVPLFLFTGMGGMAFGSWFAGMLYDRFGYYAPAFAAGVLFNLANLAVIGFLLARGWSRSSRPAIA